MKTKSEEVFENFLRENHLEFKKIKEESSPRPDYLVKVSDLRLVFEVKELGEDENFKTKSIFSVVREDDSVFAHETSSYDGKDELH